MLDQIIEAASTPQGLIILVIAAFIAATILLSLFFFAVARLFMRKPRRAKESAAPAAGESASEPPRAADPLERFEPRRQGKGPIGLARLRSLADDFSAVPTEPTLRTPASAAPEPQTAASAAPLDLPREPAQPKSAAAPSIPPAPPFEASRPAAPSPLVGARILQTLPFGRRPGLSAAHADLLGVGIEAVFFDPELVSAIEDDVIRLVPFLPPQAGRLLLREADRETFRAGPLCAQPDAVIELSGGFISLEYKSKGGRLEDPIRWAEQMREKDVLQTVIEALVLSAESGRPAAPVLRTQNAVFFLRPSAEALSLIERCAEDAAAFLAESSGGAARSGISAGDYASLLTAGFLTRFPRPRSAGSLAGEAAHASLLR